VLGGEEKTPAIVDARELVGNGRLHDDEFAFHGRREIAQQREVFMVEDACVIIDDAQGADLAAVGQLQRAAGIKTRASVTLDQRAVGETMIRCGVGN